MLQIDEAGRLVDNIEMAYSGPNISDEFKDLNNDRVEHTAKVCQEYHQEISERYQKVWPMKNYHSVMAKASLFINRDAGFMWCRVPKAASESLTLVFINRW